MSVKPTASATYVPLDHPPTSTTNHVLTQSDGLARPHTVPVSTQGKERTMLNAALGMLAMVPVAFGVAGYTMVSR